MELKMYGMVGMEMLVAQHHLVLGLVQMVEVVLEWIGEVVEHLEVEETMEEQAINLEVEVEEVVVLAGVAAVDHMEEVEDVDGILEEMDMNLILPVMAVLMVEVAVIHSLEEM